MTQEQKAKAYDEALERASKLRFQNPFDTVSQMMEHVFPELAESEDEKIRKEIIAFLKENFETGKAEETWSLSGLERWIAWLEKQGEHKDYYTKQELIDMGFSFTLNGDIITPDKMMEDMKKYLAWLEKQGEQKPKWSEEDSLMIDSIIDTIKWLEGKGATNMKIDWLKLLKQRIHDNSAKTCENDTLYDLLCKMPSYITVDGIFYHFMLRKTALAYTAYYAGEEEGSGKVIIFGVTAFSPIGLLTEMLEKLKNEGLLE